MQREVPRTLYSLSSAFQRGIEEDEYEVIVVENGSSEPLGAGLVESFGKNFRYTFLEDPPASPAYAMNLGAKMARGESLGLMIDGARIASPGMLRLAKMALGCFDRPVISTLAFHLGSEVQMQAVKRGYCPAEEDKLLASVDWRDDGYRLYEISTLAGSSRHGWFHPIAESNGVFMNRATYCDLGGFDERFVQPGGGLVNLDFYRRACDLPNSPLVVLLGEGTFHQVHGGVMTNCPAEEADNRWAFYDEEYRRLRGTHFSSPLKEPIFLGTAPVSGLQWIKKSCELFWESPSAPPAPPPSVL